MGNFFSGRRKPKSRINQQDQAVLDLKIQRDKLKQYQKRLEKNLEKERYVAKKLLSEGKKDKALLILRKKKYFESLISKTDGQLENIENLTSTLEFSQIEHDVINGLKDGNIALKKMNELMTLEDVEAVLDESREAAAYQREVESLLSGGLSKDDESDVLDELNMLIENEVANMLPDLPESPVDERVPSDAKVATAIKEEDRREVVAAI